VTLVLKIALDVAGGVNTNDSGPVGITLCILVKASVIKASANGAITSVVMHTLDRYWKIVYPIHHRKHYRRWMLHVGLVLPWLNAFAVILLPNIGIKCFRTLSSKAASIKVCLLRISFCIIYLLRECPSVRLSTTLVMSDA